MSNGARDMLDAMGVKWISPDQLSTLDASSAEVCAAKIVYEHFN